MSQELTEFRTYRVQAGIDYVQHFTHEPIPSSYADREFRGVRLRLHVDAHRNVSFEIERVREWPEPFALTDFAVAEVERFWQLKG